MKTPSHIPTPPKDYVYLGTGNHINSILKKNDKIYLFTRSGLFFNGSWESSNSLGLGMPQKYIEDSYYAFHKNSNIVKYFVKNGLTPNSSSTPNNKTLLEKFPDDFIVSTHDENEIRLFATIMWSDFSNVAWATVDEYVNADWNDDYPGIIDESLNGMDEDGCNGYVVITFTEFLEIYHGIKEFSDILQLPKINDYDGEYDEGDEFVTYGCAKISLAMLRAVLNADDDGVGNRTITSITLSEHDVNITMGEIEQIIKFVDQKNGE